MRICNAVVSHVIDGNPIRMATIRRMHAFANETSTYAGKMFAFICCAVVAAVCVAHIRHPILFVTVVAIALAPLVRREIRYFCLAGQMWWRRQPLLCCLIEARLYDNPRAERRIAAHYLRWLRIIDALDELVFLLLAVIAGVGSMMIGARFAPRTPQWLALGPLSGAVPVFLVIAMVIRSKLSLARKRAEQGETGRWLRRDR